MYEKCDEGFFFQMKKKKWNSICSNNLHKLTKVKHKKLKKKIKLMQESHENKEKEQEILKWSNKLNI